MRRFVIAFAALAGGCASLLGDFSVSPGADAGPVDGGSMQTPMDATGGGVADGSDDQSMPMMMVDAAMPPPPTCAAPKSLCGTDCVDTISSPQNCGACGHDCLGGGCMNSKCGPAPLLQNENGIYALTIDDQNVYWTVNGSPFAVKQMPIAGAATPLTLAMPGVPPTDLALDGKGRVWFVASDPTSDTYNLYSVKIGQPGATPYFTGTQNGTAHGLAADQDHLYTGVYTVGTAWSLVSFGQTNGMVSTILSGSGDRITGVASGASDVAWTGQISNRVQSTTKTSGGAVTTVSAGGQGNNLSKIVGTPGAVIWAGFGGPIFVGQFGQAASGHTLGPTVGALSGLATDGALVYYTDNNGGLVAAVPIQGGATQTIVNNRPNLGPIAATPKIVVWTEQGTLWKLVR